MKTSKPISTISYNTKDFLIANLTTLKEINLVSEFAFIRHQPEEDESKPHYHVYIELGNTVEIQKGCQLQYTFNEHDPTHPDKPLSCMPFRKSNFFDWYMYAVHDKAYLISKGQSRKYYYSDNDIFYSDKDFFSDLKQRFDRSSYDKTIRALKAMQDDNMSVSELVLQGLIPVNQVNSFMQLQRDILNRATRFTHSPKADLIDVDTGEVIAEHSELTLLQKAEQIPDSDPIAQLLDEKS